MGMEEPMGSVEAMKRCPFCAEEILAAAVKCKHCGSTLPGPDAAPPARPLGLIGTWREALMRPAAFFSRPAAERSRLSPLLFAVVVYAVGLPAQGISLALLDNK